MLLNSYLSTRSQSCIEGFIITIMWFDSRCASGFNVGSLIVLVYINDITDDIIGFGRFLADYTLVIFHRMKPVLKY